MVHFGSDSKSTKLLPNQFKLEDYEREQVESRLVKSNQKLQPVNLNFD